MRHREAPKQQVDVIPTGSLGLDMALGVGGIPKGRIIEIYGPESGGKTTLALSIIAQAQQMGGVAAFIDAEHALDPLYAKSLGVNIDDLLVSQPDTGEQALEIVELLARSGAVDVVVVDSVAALVPQAGDEGNIGDAFVGVQARLMSQALRKLTAVLAKSNTAAIFINQIREKVGTMYGNPKPPPAVGPQVLRLGEARCAQAGPAHRGSGQRSGAGGRVKVKGHRGRLAPPSVSTR